MARDFESEYRNTWMFKNKTGYSLPCYIFQEAMKACNFDAPWYCNVPPLIKCLEFAVHDGENDRRAAVWFDQIKSLDHLYDIFVSFISGESQGQVTKHEPDYDNFPGWESTYFRNTGVLPKDSYIAIY